LPDDLTRLGHEIEIGIAIAVGVAGSRMMFLTLLSRRRNRPAQGWGETRDVVKIGFNPSTGEKSSL
jgi:hypothetical protein